MGANRDRILEKMRHIKELASHGVAGEQENAASLLGFLKEKYDIADDEVEVEKEIEWFRYKTPLEKRLLAQITYSVTGGKAVWIKSNTETGREYKMIGVECTSTEKQEIKMSFDFYKAVMESELETFFTAFIHKNHIFPPESISGQPQTNEKELSREDVRKIVSMMDGMDKHQRHTMIEETTGGK